MIEPEFLTIKETATFFSVHVNTIRRAIKMGYLVAIRIGNGPKSPYRISKKSLEAIHASVIKQLAASVKN